MRLLQTLREHFNDRWLLLLLIAIGVILYANTLPNEMFWDDFDNILNNSFIQNWRYFPKLFTENIIAGAGLASNYWRPILMMIFSIEWHLWGSWAPGYHLINTALHITNAILLFYLLWHILKEIWNKPHSKEAALLTSLVFLIHPVQTEAVTYISGLADPLAAFFIFSGILLYLRFRTSHPSSPATYYLSLTTFILALMTKEAAIVMPAFIFLIDLLSPDRNLELKKRLQEATKRLWPYATVATVYILFRSTVLNFGGTFNLYGEEQNILTENLHVRLFTFFRVLVEYLKILFWPAQLHAERTVTTATSLLYPDVIVGGLVLAGLLTLAAAQFKRRPTLSFGISWFLIGLAPVSNIAVPINSLIMEHWLYLPIIGVALILVWMGTVTIESRTFLKGPLLAIFIAAAVLLSIRTIARNREWRDPITFYNQTLQYAPNSYRIVNNLGMAYADAEDHEKAEKMYERAIALDSTNPVAYHNLGNIYKELGERELAISNFQTAIGLDPEFFFSYNALADLYLKEGNYREVRKVFESYLEYSPSKVDVLILLANIATKEEDLEGALAYLEEALLLDPSNATIRAAMVKLRSQR